VTGVSAVSPPPARVRIVSGRNRRRWRQAKGNTVSEHGPGIDPERMAVMLEVLAEIKKDERTRGIPTVLLTSSNMQEEMLQAYLGGANSFLKKPMDFDQFDELIRHVGYYWVHLNQKPDVITLVADEPEERERDLTFAGTV